MTANIPLTEVFQAQGPEFIDALILARRTDDEILKLVAMRKRSGLSLSDIAAKMETTQRAVADIESLYGEPSLAMLQRYAHACGGSLKVRAVEINYVSALVADAAVGIVRWAFDALVALRATVVELLARIEDEEQFKTFSTALADAFEDAGTRERFVSDVLAARAAIIADKQGSGE